MTGRQSVRVVESLWYEVLQATTMLLFLLSSMAVSRRKHYQSTGRTTGMGLPGLPEICLTPTIFNVPDDELYGPTGVAAQMAYKGWLVDVFVFWEHRFRREWKDSLGEGAIPPEFDAFGDLRHIRSHSFIRVCARGRSLFGAPAPGTAPPPASFSGGQPDVITAPGRFGLTPPAPPWTLRAAFGTLSLGKGDASAMAVATTRFSGRAFSVQEVTLIREIRASPRALRYRGVTAALSGRNLVLCHE